MSEKLITVFSATGRQGTSVVSSLIANGFEVRALTRNPEGVAAKQLQGKGCQVVKVDMNDEDSLQEAIAGSFGVFINTNFWGLLKEYPDSAMEREIAEGKVIADICKREGVQHVVYSGTDNVKEATGRVCSLLDGKALTERYLDTIGVPTTCVHVPFYYENFIDSSTYRPQKNKDGTYSMTWPLKGRMYTMSVRDLGPIILSIFTNADKYIGKTIDLAREKLTASEYAAIMSEVTGKTVSYNLVSVDEYAQFPFPAAPDLAAMFEYYDIGNWVMDIELTCALNPNALTFRQWAEKNKDNLLV